MGELKWVEWGMVLGAAMAAWTMLGDTGSSRVLDDCRARCTAPNMACSANGTNTGSELRRFRCVNVEGYADPASLNQGPCPFHYWLGNCPPKALEDGVCEAVIVHSSPCYHLSIDASRDETEDPVSWFWYLFLMVAITAVVAGLTALVRYAYAWYRYLYPDPDRTASEYSVSLASLDTAPTVELDQDNDNPDLALINNDLIFPPDPLPEPNPQEVPQDDRTDSEEVLRDDRTDSENEGDNARVEGNHVFLAGPAPQPNPLQVFQDHNPGVALMDNDLIFPPAPAN